MPQLDMVTRDLAVEALTTIKNHMESCDNRYLTITDQQKKTIEYLEGIYKQIASMRDEVAEARGAARMAKFITSGIAAIAGLFGGVAGHIALK